MGTKGHFRSATGGWALAVLAGVALAGCAGSRPQTAPESAAPQTEVIAPQPTAEPAPVRTAPVVSPVRRKEVAVLFEPATASSVAVAEQIAALLPPDRYRVSQMAIGEAPPEVPRTAPAAIVAVGMKAVEAARSQLPGTPIVFCQVFAYEEALDGGGPIWGVHSVPPLTLQLRNWKAVDPSLRTVAVILSEVHADLAAEAVRAAGTIATDVRLETSSSDRETLYLFKRLASDVDGLWLFPDNRVLSPTVLRELLGYASSHGVGVLAFNDALLQWGALLSVSSTPMDVAQSVREVLDRVVAGKTKGLPAMTPLSVLDLQVNLNVANRLGLPAVPQARWVTREPD